MPRKIIGVSVPIFTFMRLWAIYIFPRSVCLFCWRKYVDRSWDYINRSQTHECWNWGWGRAIPRKGIHKWGFRYSAPVPIKFLQLISRRTDSCHFSLIRFSPIISHHQKLIVHVSLSRFLLYISHISQSFANQILAIHLPPSETYCLFIA